MADVITRLLMDSSNYTSGIEKAQKSLDKYMEKNVNLGSVLGNVTGIIGKFAAGVGLAMGAQEAFDRIIKGSQTTSDEYDRIMRSVNTTIDSFFTSISTGDFTIFNQGLDGIIAKAREANDALDALGNATISYNYVNTRNQAKFADAIATLRDKNANKADKDAAKLTVDSIMGSQKDISTQFRLKTQQAMKALIAEKNTLKAGEIDLVSFDNSMLLDITDAGEDMKKELGERYDEYKRIYDKVVAQYTTRETVGMGRGVRTLKVTDWDKVNEEMSKVNDKYQDAIIYNTVLVKMTDNELKNLTELAGAADNADRALAGMQKTLNRATQTTIKSDEKKDKLPSGPGFVEIDQMVKLTIDRMTDNPLDKEILDAIEKKKQLPVLIQPVQMLMKMNEEEEANLEKDEFVEGLKRKLELYNLIEDKIAEYTSLLTVASEADREKIEKEIKYWKNLEKQIGITKKEGSDLSEISNALGVMGGALQSTGNDWLSFIGQSASAAGTLIQVIQSLTAAKGAEAIAEQAGSNTWPINLIAVASTLAAMTSAINSVKSIGNFAEGGIVGGTNYQDGITARVSSGEMFINEADQKRLYDAIHTGNFGGSGGGRTVITGEQIVTVVNNFGKRTGKGTILKG